MYSMQVGSGKKKGASEKESHSSRIRISSLLLRDLNLQDMKKQKEQCSEESKKKERRIVTWTQEVLLLIFFCVYLLLIN